MLTAFVRVSSDILLLPSDEKTKQAERDEKTAQIEKHDKQLVIWSPWCFLCLLLCVIIVGDNGDAIQIGQCPFCVLRVCFVCFQEAKFGVRLPGLACTDGKYVAHTFYTARTQCGVAPVLRARHASWPQ